MTDLQKAQWKAVKKALNTSDIDWRVLKSQRKTFHTTEEFIKDYLDPQSDTKKILHEKFIEPLKKYLHEHSTIGKGEFIPIGSFYAEFNTAANRDFDFLYACPWPNGHSFERTDAEQPFGDIVEPSETLDVHEYRSLDAKEYQELFRKYIEEAILQIDLPECLIHSGFCRPEYSGTRANGPAITCLLEDIRDPYKIITVDITLAFVAPETERTAFIKRLRTEPCWKSIQRFSELCTGESPILHIVPLIDSLRGYHWQLTTAVLETRLPRQTQVVNIVRKIKELASTLSLKSTREVYEAAGINKHPILEKLESMNSTDVDNVEWRKDLRKKLFHDHIHLPNYVEQIYHEKTEKIISVNSAAVKFYVLGEVAREKGPLNEDKCVSITQEFFHLVPDGAVKHPFLLNKVKTCKLAGYALRKAGYFPSIFKIRVRNLLTNMEGTENTETDRKIDEITAKCICC